MKEKNSLMYETRNYKVSIIVPVYNVAPYIHRCLDSLLSQSVHNYEIILVDDGSMDDSGTICDEYEKKYEFIRTYHKQNEGLSSARNVGVKKSNGDYITFVDSDDYVSPTYIEELLFLIEEYEVDMSILGIIRVLDLKKPKIYVKKENFERVFSTQEALEEMCYMNYYNVSACGKLFKRELVEKNPFPVGKYYEDLASTYKMIAQCSRIAFRNSYGYYYVQRNNGIVHGCLNEQKINDGLEAASQQLSFIEKFYPDIIRAAYFQFASNIDTLMILLNGGGKYERASYNRLRKLLFDVVFKKQILFDHRASYFKRMKFVSLLLGYSNVKRINSIVEKRILKQQKRFTSELINENSD